MLVCISITVFYAFDKTSADKGRKYYEDAGSIVWEIKTKEKVVALTFDDGPHPEYTVQILDLLEQHDAKGTFFIVGEHAENHSQIVYRMYEEGHEIANHTYTHPFTKSVPKIMQEIKQTDYTLFSITGYSPKLFRPVEGNYTDPLVEAVSKEGYKIVMWSWHQDTEDWKDPGVNTIVNKVINGIEEGNIVLFHDGGGNREQTVKAIEIILPKLKEQGYKFITVSEMLQLQQQEEETKNLQLQ
ncbi:MAG: polysaccharide deacetylase family protein [Lysinibacillus sp.]